MLTILCIATYFKGERFLQECRRLGCTVLLLTVDSLAGAAWPRDAIDEIHSIPRDATDADIRRRVDAVARRHRIERVAALDDFDVETGAMLREHLQLPGFGRTTAAGFRDKLAMRTRARAIGLGVPEFTAVFNDQEVNDFAARVPPPWVLKPRSSAAAIGIKKVADAEQLWRALHEAGDERSNGVLEHFVPGDVYHVDSIVFGSRVVFAVASRYATPPMAVAHEGGIFVTRTLPADDPTARGLIALNRQLLAAFGMQRGVSHTEFIRAADGTLHFLETSARVGGAYIVDVVEAATGINLWREWARVEIAGEHGAYTPPASRGEIAGIVLSLARQQSPDMSAYTDDEIVYRVRKRHHAGLIVRSTDPDRVTALLDSYVTRFYQDFHASAPPPTRAAE